MKLIEKIFCIKVEMKRITNFFYAHVHKQNKVFEVFYSMPSKQHKAQSTYKPRATRIWYRNNRISPVQQEKHI